MAVLGVRTHTSAHGRVHAEHSVHHGPTGPSPPLHARTSGVVCHWFRPCRSAAGCRLQHRAQVELLLAGGLAQPDHVAVLCLMKVVPVQVAAYLLDHGHFSGVPPTALVSCKQDPGRPGMHGTEVKVGSLQAFVGSDSDCEERGPQAFPTSEVAPAHTVVQRLSASS